MKKTECGLHWVEGRAIEMPVGKQPEDRVGAGVLGERTRNGG